MGAELLWLLALDAYLDDWCIPQPDNETTETA